MISKLLFALASLAFLSAPAMATGGGVDSEYMDAGGNPVGPPRKATPPRVRDQSGFPARAAPRVYGWPSRGCGEFKYWDGQRCADARDKPAKKE